MKKSILLLLISVFWAIQLPAQNTNTKSGKCGNNIEWSFDGRTLVITNTTLKKESADIPDYDLSKNISPWVKQKLSVRKVIIGKGIRRIGSCAFANCEELTTVEFEDVYLGEIGWGAFLNCKNLFNFSIPVNVRRIGTIAFANCSSLRSIKIPNLVRVEDQAFRSCTGLTLIEIDDNALLGKAVFTIEDNNNGNTTFRCYNGEIRNLPLNINTDNCMEYGLDKDAVAICLKNSEPYKSDARLSNVDTNIPEGPYTRYDTYALIIGNQNYRFVSDVPFAKNDANIFAEYCKKTMGIPAANIHLCENATKHMILEQELEDWLKHDITNRIDKKLIIYYAGHGVPDIQDNNKAYLLPVDVYGTKPHQGISLDYFYKYIGELGFERVTVFIDACFSGVNRDNEGLNVERAVEVEAEDPVPSTGNLIVFSAAHGNETAQSFQEEGHGLFTYYLLKELQDTQGITSYGRLTDNIRRNVSNVAPTLELRKKQTPKAFSSFSNSSWRSLEF